VHPFGDLQFVELTQARLNLGEWSNVFKASRDELDLGAGLDVASCLLELGAECVDTREAAMGDETGRRTFLCAVFRERSSIVPAAAYVLTRIAPLMRGVRAS
jgi:hypothetical protein